MNKIDEAAKKAGIEILSVREGASADLQIPCPNDETELEFISKVDHYGRKMDLWACPNCEFQLITEIFDGEYYEI